MADAVTTQVLQDGERLYVAKFTNISDGTGESAVTKIDVSTLARNAFNLACNGLKLAKIWAQTDGMGVNILWDATTNVITETVPQNVMYTADYNCFGGIPNNSGVGKTGNLLFSTVGASSGDRYTIILECVKTYASA